MIREWRVYKLMRYYMPNDRYSDFNIAMEVRNISKNSSKATYCGRAESQEKLSKAIKFAASREMHSDLARRLILTYDSDSDKETAKLVSAEYIIGISEKKSLDIKLIQASSTKEQKQPLIKALENYINRIESYKANGSIDYAHDFWFFAQSRAVNRHANYLLAKSLKDALSEPDAFIPHVFYNLDAKRNALFKDRDNRLDSSAKRGINSCELNNIISMAKSINEQAVTATTEAPSY